MQLPVCQIEYRIHSRLVFKKNQAAIFTLDNNPKPYYIVIVRFRIIKGGSQYV